MEKLSDQQPAFEDSEYMELLVQDVRKTLKHDIFSEEQIRSACKDALTSFNEGEYLPLIDNQSRFCDRCATCCRVCDPITITLQEVQKIGKHFGLSVAKFMKKYRVSQSGKSNFYNMKAKPCPFLKEPNICTIYDIRPQVCSGFPVQKIIAEMAEEQKDIELPKYCHVIQKANTYRVISRLLLETELGKQAKLHFQQSQYGVLSEQIEKIEDPLERMIAIYRLSKNFANSIKRELDGK